MAHALTCSVSFLIQSSKFNVQTTNYKNQIPSLLQLPRALGKKALRKAEKAMAKLHAAGGVKKVG